MEEIRPSKRLERGLGTEASHVKWRTDQHPCIDGRHEIPRVQADRGELCSTRKWDKSDGGEGSVRCRRGVKVTLDGSLREEEGKKVPRVGWGLQGG